MLLYFITILELLATHKLLHFKFDYSACNVSVIYHVDFENVNHFQNCYLSTLFIITFYIKSKLGIDVTRRIYLHNYNDIVITYKIIRHNYKQ